MPNIINNPVSEVFRRWSDGVKEVVGDSNYSMDTSQTIASNKKKYARLLLMGNPTLKCDLNGNECATTLSFQAESYASGTKALSKVYEIDEISHVAMVSMGFRRTYGAELTNNADGSIKRLISRYSRVYTGYLPSKITDEPLQDSEGFNLYDDDNNQITVLI